MTRINVNIDVRSLTDEHLLAEHREIKRLPAFYQKGLYTDSLNKIPKEFCLGTGHVTFFLDKFTYTLDRYKEIYQECLNRGFEVEDYSSNWMLVKDEKYKKRIYSNRRR